MRLIDLEPQFVVYREEPFDNSNGLNPHLEGTIQQYQKHVDTLQEAQGIVFVCPLCYTVLGKREGAHSIDVTFADRGVPDHQGSHNSEGKPSRWQVSGSGYHDLTTKPSIHLTSSCGWHGYITNGEAS